MNEQQQNNIYDTSIRLLFLSFIIAWCLLILLPFVSIILRGVVGGFIFSGFIGLFTGAIVLSLGYKLFIAWID